jgi:hypothetical protein
MWTVPDRRSYSYLLGMYLGDGWVGPPGRPTRLCFTLDSAYPAIIAETIAATQTAALGSPVTTWRRRVDRGIVINCYAGHWGSAFPQYGPGRKHQRPIALTDWQREVVDAHPEPFLRGLIHSDGCRTVNRLKTKLPSGRVAEYEYPRYFFSNLSADIRGLFCEYCERLGVRWTQSNHRNISVSHRRSVAILDAFIGPKS